MNGRAARRNGRPATVAGLALLALAADAGIPSAAQPAQTQDICPSCISIRIGRPIVLRGPSADSDDAPFSVIKLADGRFRGFTANGSTYAIDGAAPLDMGGARRAVLKPGPKGSPGDCGRWITSVIPSGTTLYALIHNEQSCNYAKNQTYKSMSIGQSSDEGLTWTDLGQIITSGEAVSPGRANGEGDCRAVDGNDGYIYAYCLRVADWKNTAARARKSNPAPGQWFKWDGKGWSVPALGGVGAPLHRSPGMSAAYWATQKLFFLLSNDRGIKLSVSQDKVNFVRAAEPLIHYDADEWKRPAPTELYAYPSLIGAQGGNRLGTKIFLSYTYVPAGEDFSRRYLVMHEASFAAATTPVSPQVRVALSRFKKADGARWATTGPAIENKSAATYAFETELGDLMTAPPPTAGVKIEECVRAGPNGPEHMLANGSCAEDGYQRRRTAGWAYRERQPGTVPLVRCVTPRREIFVSSDERCEGMGANQQRLGYVMQD